MHTGKPLIMVLDGSSQALPFYHLLKSFGAQSICVDRNPNAPAHVDADFSFVHSVLDIDSILRSLNRDRLSPTDIWTFSEFTVEAAILKSRLKLNGPAVEAVRVSQDKVECNKIWNQETWPHAGGSKSRGPRIPASYLVREGDGQDSSRLNEDVVFKSAEGSGGLQVRYSPDDFEENPLDPPYLVQEKILGSSHDGNAYLKDGRFFPLNVYDRYFIKASVAQSCLHSPTLLEPHSVNDFFKQFHKAVSHLGISEGPVKLDAMRKADTKIYVLEIATRLHGPMGSLFLLARSSQNPFRELSRLGIFPGVSGSSTAAPEEYSAVLCLYPGLKYSEPHWISFASWFMEQFPSDTVIKLSEAKPSTRLPRSNHEMVAFLTVYGTSPTDIREKSKLIERQLDSKFTHLFWREGVESCLSENHISDGVSNYLSR